MNNKYNLNYYETMEVANIWLDRMEDDIAYLQSKFKDNPEQLEKGLESMKTNYESILHFEDMLNLYLEIGDHQSVSNQLVMNEMLLMLIRDVLPDTDLSYIDDYLESISERQLIEDVTRIIDKYNKEMI